MFAHLGNAALALCTWCARKFASGTVQEIEGKVDRLQLPKGMNSLLEETDHALSGNPIVGRLQAITDPTVCPAPPPPPPRRHAHPASHAQLMLG